MAKITTDFLESLLTKSIQWGSQVLPRRKRLRFQGAGIQSIQDDPEGDATVVTIPTVGAGSTTIQNNGSPLTQRSVVNFSAPLVATDNGVQSRTDITFQDNIYALVSGTRPFTGPITVQGTVVSTNIKRGTGDPNGSISGSVNDLFQRTDQAGIYRNTNGSTGWVSITAGGGDGLAAPSDPSDDGKVAFAQSGDLVYETLNLTHIDAGIAAAGAVPVSNGSGAFSATGPRLLSGSGDPSASSAGGAIYQNATGSVWVNTNGSTTWARLATLGSTAPTNVGGYTENHAGTSNLAARLDHKHALGGGPSVATLTTGTLDLVGGSSHVTTTSTGAVSSLGGNEGQWVLLQKIDAGTLTLTDSAAITCPNEANIEMVAGDWVLAVGNGSAGNVSNNWTVIRHFPASFAESGLTPPDDPDDDGKFTIADSGDLTYVTANLASLNTLIGATLDNASDPRDPNPHQHELDELEPDNAPDGAVLFVDTGEVKADGPQMFSGSGSPSLSAQAGAVYQRTDNGSLYVNVDGSTTWAQLAAGSSLSAPADPADDGKLAVAAGGDLNYITGSISLLTAPTIAQINSWITDATLDDASSPRDPNAHFHDITDVNSFSLAQLNSRLSNATLDDVGDPRDPNAHEHALSDLDSTGQTENHVLKVNGSDGIKAEPVDVSELSANGATDGNIIVVSSGATITQPGILVHQFRDVAVPANDSVTIQFFSGIAWLDHVFVRSLHNVPLLVEVQDAYGAWHVLGTANPMYGDSFAVPYEVSAPASIRITNPDSNARSVSGFCKFIPGFPTSIGLRGEIAGVLGVLPQVFADARELDLDDGDPVTEFGDWMMVGSPTYDLDGWDSSLPTVELRRANQQYGEAHGSASMFNGGPPFVWTFTGRIYDLDESVWWLCFGNGSSAGVNIRVYNNATSEFVHFRVGSESPIASAIHTEPMHFGVVYDGSVASVAYIDDNGATTLAENAAQPADPELAFNRLSIGARVTTSVGNYGEMQIGITSLTRCDAAKATLANLEAVLALHNTAYPVGD